jgi:arginyl-tRNA--protein-N-Asp/Glu arginylyltransferase
MIQSFLRYIAPPSQCGYLPDQQWSLEYDHAVALTAAEYMDRMVNGWRRFGGVLFRPRCRTCSACQSLRVLVEQFHPDRSQQRARKANEGVIQLKVGEPSVTPEKLALYDRYHAHQTKAKGWPAHGAKDEEEYVSSFVHNPFATQEWCYYRGDILTGVGYVDDLPGALSAIYFFYDPAERSRSPGTWHVLSLLEAARARRIPYLYLGYYVAGCPSMTYKSRFRPNQLLGLDGRWHDFQG